MAVSLLAHLFGQTERGQHNGTTSACLTRADTIANPMLWHFVPDFPDMEYRLSLQGGRRCHVCAPFICVSHLPLAMFAPDDAVLLGCMKGGQVEISLPMMRYM